MKKLILAGIAFALLAGCASSPPMPKEPDEGNRIPVNKTVPEELKAEAQ